MNRPARLWPPLLTILLIGLILAVANLFVVTMSVLLLTFAGVLLGVFLNGPSRWIASRTTLPYRVSYAIVVVVLLGVVVGGFAFLGSQVVEQAAVLSSEVRSAGEELVERLSHYEEAQPFMRQIGSWQKGLAADGWLAAEALKGVQQFGWAVTAILVILFIGLYAAFDPDLYKSGLLKLVPPDRRDRADKVLHQLHAALAKWIVARLISMSIIGVLTAVGLWLLSVPLPVTLGVVAALLTFIPNIGPIMAAVPQALLALRVGTDTVLYVVLFNIVLQTVESYLVTPMVQRYQVTLPPVLTIFVQLLMAVLVGIIGVLLAAPLTAAAMVLIQMLYVQDRLGDPHPGRLVDGG